MMALLPFASVSAAPRPPVRPDDMPSPAPKSVDQPAAKKSQHQTACAALTGDNVDARLLPPKIDGDCGTNSPYLLRSIKIEHRKIELTSPATVNCAMGTAFVDWVKRVDQLSRTTHGVEVARVRTGASYICRRRNNAKSGKISEHGFANALDLTGFDLANGRQVHLPAAWQAGGADEMLTRQSHQLGCTIFTTVLGPEANALHKDHLHLDMGCHGKSCTFKICD